jgi:hypothetical protein
MGGQKKEEENSAFQTTVWVLLLASSLQLKQNDFGYFVLGF